MSPSTSGIRHFRFDPGVAGVWWRIAWRNLWRNRRRTLITAAALAFGFLASVLMIGVSDGIVAEMIDNGTRVLTGQVQVHATGWLPQRDVAVTLGDGPGPSANRVLPIVAGTPGVLAAAPRVYAGGLLSIGERTVAAQFLGVDPERERGVSRVLAAVVSGQVPTAGARDLLLGDQVARQLNVGIGGELVVVAPAADGSMGNDLFRVSGIFHTGLPELDGGLAIFRIGSLQALLALAPDQVHEVAATVATPWAADSVAAAVDRRLRAAGVAGEARPWTRFRPELAAYAALARSYNGLVVAIVFGMAIFGVANTMLMGAYERKREFAVVRALGTAPGGVARTVVYEGLLLGVIALTAGVVMTTPLVWWLHRSPLDLSGLFGGFTMAGALVRPILRVEPSWNAPLLSALALLLTGVLAACWPAWRAARLPPADVLSGR